MKKIFIFLLAALPFISFAGEKIEHFDAAIKINEDATVEVTESIDYDFDNLGSDKELHGLYRDIPYQYKSDFGKFNFDFSNISVNTDNFEFYKRGKYLRIDTNPDPNIHVRGTVPYIFKYKVNYAIGYFDNFDELYWNVTGNEWNVPIISSRATVLLPKDILISDIKASCYQGSIGSNENCDFFIKDEKGYASYITFSPTRELGLKEGMTVAVGFPKGIVYEPNSFEKFIRIFSDNLIFSIPLFVFLIMYFRWRRTGRDPIGSGVIIPQYDIPKELSPLEVAIIIRQKIKNQDISSEIISLAIKGYVVIKKIEKPHIWSSEDYVFLRTEKNDENLKKHEIILLDSLFGGISIRIDSGKKEVKLSSLKEKFYKKMEKIIEEVNKSAFEKGFYEKNPKNARDNYIAISIILFVLSLFFVDFAGEVIIFVGLISALIIFLFSFHMPRKTEKGVRLYEYLLGLKEYLQIAEKDRINFHNAPEKKPEIFEKFLPYAMVLGVEKAWAKEFKDIYVTPPNWYQDTGGGGVFNLVNFTSSINSFSVSAGNVLSSAPGGSSGSSGGGFSGGGGGGGGGGSH